MEFGQRLRRNLKNRGCCGQTGTILVFNCFCLWKLGSASSVTCRSVDVRAGIGTRLIINCVHMWNLGNASGLTRWILIVRGWIGTRLVINWVCLWILGSASGITRRIVEWDLSLIASASWIWAAPSAWPDELSWIFVVELGRDLSFISFAYGMWAAPPA